MTSDSKHAPSKEVVADSKTKSGDDEEPSFSAPNLMRQLSANSKTLLTTAFEQLDVQGTGYITRKEAVRFYETFCNAKQISMMGAILKESASMTLKEFDKQTSSSGQTQISFDEWSKFFEDLQIPDDKLEEILQQFVPSE